MNLESLIKDAGFKTQIQNTTNFSEVVEILRNYGVETTEAELKAASISQEEQELNEDALEKVAGGLWNPLLALLPFLIPSGPALPLRRKK